MTSADFDPNTPRYSPPPAGSPQRPYVHPGSLSTRFFARLIDGILVNIVVFVLTLFFFPDYWGLVTGLFSGVLMFGYFVLFEVTQGASLGKRLLGLSVLGPGGLPRPTASQSAIRNSFTLLAVVPYVGPLLAFIAYVVIAVTINASPCKQGKHDELAGGTQVIKR
ncbi:RDD family protein [Mycobacterium cookii]|uniref:RDD family protein n=1 Tax=Mycobacterium cookii TaxID=1775 RepID=A0A7I7KTY4_9MYCO|nr:RDD family protein [Mycobacterium cookii]MCV7330939.1 RDD family protein [Mycobacterium cookii]BBX45071.1 RDD family protein [Mycobacterium cookii]